MQPTTSVSAAFFLITFSVAAASLSPGEQLVTTFTSVPNSSDVLHYYSQDDLLAISGDPVLTTILYNGNTPLGTFVGKVTLQKKSAGGVWVVTFASSASGAPAYPQQWSKVDLGVMNNGTIVGRLVTTVSGGSITSFNPNASTLYDAAFSPPGGFQPRTNVTKTGVTVSLATPALQFVPVTPCRIADTRNSAGSFGGPAIPAGTARSFPIPGNACGIPSTAQSYSLNVTVVPRGALGFVTVFPGGQSVPLASTLNSLDGRVKANAAIIPAGANGEVSVFATDTTDVILDINGYFIPPDASTLAFYRLTPCRGADTRGAAGQLSGPSLVGGQQRSFPVRLSACNVPATAQAYSLNFTAVPQGSLGYIRLGPPALPGLWLPR